jgi:hypothetical protein
VVNGPLDASNTTEMPKMQDAYEFLEGMELAVPGIFTRLSGWASNPYSVPHQGPDLRYTHRAYESELEFIGRDMPVLITEAGHLNTGDDKEIAAFYEAAFRDWMADPRVVAVTPLFWHPDRGVYWMFDFDERNNVINKTPTYDLIMRLPRQRGSPEFTPDLGNVARSGSQPGVGSNGPLQAARGNGTPATEASGAVRYLRVGNADGDPVRLRERPSRTAPAITAVPEGTRVRALGTVEQRDDLSWERIRIPDGREGWMAADFLIPD